MSPSTTWFALLHQTSTIQNRASRAHGGPDLFRLDPMKLINDLLGPPTTVLSLHPDDDGFDIDRSLVWAGMRGAASVGQALQVPFPIPIHPFVASLSTHSKVLTKLLHVEDLSLPSTNKHGSLTHGRRVLPRHGPPPYRITSVLPMCPVYVLTMCPVRTTSRPRPPPAHPRKFAAASARPTSRREFQRGGRLSWRQGEVRPCMAREHEIFSWRTWCLGVSFGWVGGNSKFEITGGGRAGTQNSKLKTKN